MFHCEKLAIPLVIHIRYSWPDEFSGPVQSRKVDGLIALYGVIFLHVSFADFSFPEESRSSYQRIILE